MNRRSITLSGTIAAAIVLAGCAGTPDEDQAGGPPSWVLSPQVDNGLAATGCTPAVGNLSLERTRANALARQELASSISVQVQSLTEDYQRQITTEQDGISTGGNFEVVSRQIVDQELIGSQAVTADYVTLDGQRNFCSMVTVNEETVDNILQLTAQAADINPEDFTTSQLREQYMSQEALNRLDEAVE